MIKFKEWLEGRCWKGYEPVPGKKAYADDSCQPKKKEDKKEKGKKNKK